MLCNMLYLYTKIRIQRNMLQCFEISMNCFASPLVDPILLNKDVIILFFVSFVITYLMITFCCNEKTTCL